MQPFYAVKKFVDVHVLRLYLAYRAVRPVVNDVAGTLRTALFAEIYTHSFAAAHDLLRIDAVSSQLSDAFVRNRVGRKFREESHVLAELRQRYRDIGFAAAVNRLVRFSLRESLVSVRLKSEHYLSYRQNTHIFNLS